MDFSQPLIGHLSFGLGMIYSPALLESRFALSHASSIISNDSGSASRWSLPTSIRVQAGSPLFLTSSSESAKGTTSSARLCRIVVFGFTVLAEPYFFQAGQSSPRGEAQWRFIAIGP